MAEPTIRISYQSLKAIPDEHKRVLHSMYEDNDLDGAGEAEELIEWLEKEMPGSFVGILANDSVTPGCDTWAQEHYHCELYAPHWYTVLVPKKIWDEYKPLVEEADKAWKAKNQCKMVSAKAE